MSTSSPTIDIGSSESSMSEDAVTDIVAKLTNSAAKDTNIPFSRRESSKSPALDHGGRSGSGQRRKSHPPRQSGTPYGEESSDTGGQHGGPGRKKRARSTPDDFEANGRKSVSATDLQRESSLWPGADVDGPFQSSLLEEVLAEKKMALLRSPEVMRFLQQRQALLQASQDSMAAESEQTDFSAGEVEDDSQQSS